MKIFWQGVFPPIYNRFSCILETNSLIGCLHGALALVGERLCGERSEGSGRAAVSTCKTPVCCGPLLRANPHWRAHRQPHCPFEPMSPLSPMPVLLFYLLSAWPLSVCIQTSAVFCHVTSERLHFCISVHVALYLVWGASLKLKCFFFQNLPMYKPLMHLRDYIKAVEQVNIGSFWHAQKKNICYTLPSVN